MTIQELIERIGLNDAALAVRLCVAPMTTYRWRTGRKVPTPYMRKALTKLAHVTVEDVTWERIYE